MKKSALAIIAVILSSSACTRVVEVQVDPTEPPETTTYEPAPAPASTGSRYSRRELFLETLYSINPDLDGYDMDATFFDGALGTCEALDTGLTIDDVIATAVDSAGSDPDLQLMFASVLATTLTVLCPEYEYMMPQ